MNPQEILGAAMCLGSIAFFSLLLLLVQRAIVLNTIRRMQKEGLSDEEIREVFREAFIRQDIESF